MFTIEMLRRVSAGAILSLFVAACGGGGGGSSTPQQPAPPPPPPPPVDGGGNTGGNGETGGGETGGEDGGPTEPPEEEPGEGGGTDDGEGGSEGGNGGTGGEPGEGEEEPGNGDDEDGEEEPGGGDDGTEEEEPEEVVNLAPEWMGPRSYALSENRAVMISVLISDPENDQITAYVDDSLDGALFQIVADRYIPGDMFILANTSNGAFNYELPLDADGDNLYELNVIFSDGVNTVTETISIDILDVDDLPVCTREAEVEWYENETGLVYTFDGFDEDGPGEYGSLELLRFPHGLWAREDYEAAFRLDRVTGELFLDVPFDAEEMENYPDIEFAVSYTQADVQIYCGLTIKPMDVEGIVTSGIRLRGAVRSTANMGDIDGDGLDELWVETVIESDIGGMYPEAYVVYGKTLRDAYAQTGAADIELALLQPNEAVRLYAQFPFPSTGVFNGVDETFFTRRVGDVDGDGIPDFLVGVRPTNSAENSVANLDRPYAYLIWGSALATSGGAIDLLNISPSQGLIISGPGDVSRRKLDATSGDFDGDGVPDLVISLSDIFVPERGQQPANYVIFGDELINARASGVLRVDTNNQVLRIGGTSSFSGYSEIRRILISPGDIDGDGLSDLLMAGGNTFSGYLPGAVIRDLQRNQTHEFFDHALPISYPVNSVGFGLQLFDLENDGVPDVLFSLDAAMGQTDIAMIISGQSVAGQFPPGPDEMYYPSGYASTRILYHDEISNRSDIIGIGDIDGDGLQDIAVGISTMQDFENGPLVQIVFGAALADSPSQRVDLGALAVGQGLELRGIARGGLGFVRGMSSISDIDDDGRMDIVLVSPARREVYIIPSTDVLSAVNAGQRAIQLETRFAFEPSR